MGLQVGFGVQGLRLRLPRTWGFPSIMGAGVDIVYCGYNGVIRGLYWGYIGVITGLSWGYIGVIMGLYWGYTGVILGL